MLKMEVDLIDPKFQKLMSGGGVGFFFWWIQNALKLGYSPPTLTTPRKAASFCFHER